MEIVNVWLIKKYPDKMILELPNSNIKKHNLKMTDIQPFRILTDDDLEIYTDLHPRSLTGILMTIDLYQYYGLTKINERWSEIVQTRCTVQEKAYLQQQADMLTGGNMSLYLRKKIFDEEVK